MFHYLSRSLKISVSWRLCLLFLIQYNIESFADNQYNSFLYLQIQWSVHSFRCQNSEIMEDTLCYYCFIQNFCWWSNIEEEKIQRKHKRLIYFVLMYWTSQTANYIFPFFFCGALHSLNFHILVPNKNCLLSTRLQAGLLLKNCWCMSCLSKHYFC